jgi:release factor glutamine methyltransferase
MATWRDVREEVQRALTDAELESATRDARWIMEEVSGRRGGELILADRESAPAVAGNRARDMARRRVAGEPLQYVLGSWAFLDLEVMVDPRVLIPRPETEVTAQVAIDEAVRLGAQRGKANAWTAPAASFPVVDLGTGSGVLALALAGALRDVEIWATDVNAEALAVARANLAGAGATATRIRLTQGDWFGALPESLRGTLRLVVANPPYVAEAEAAELPVEVAHYEPVTALVSGPTGTEAVQRIVTDAPEWLDAGGSLVCEISSRRRDDAVACARDAGFVDVEVRRDLAGRDRVLIARRA